MGRQNNDTKTKEKNVDTRVLYKKSNVTLLSHSRTCSGVSQLYSRSAVLQIKKNLQHSTNYYTEGGKVKRDLSIETDICVLRRYYRNKKFKASTNGSLAKSKYSTVFDTEVGTIEEYPDISACGDNEQAEMKGSPTLDVAALMVDNLKDLLHMWFRRHLDDNKKVRLEETIDEVLNSLIHQLEQMSDKSSSYSTYILCREACNKQVKDKKVATASNTCQRRKHRIFSLKGESSKNIIQNYSSLSMPFSYNDMKIISTLSLPRKFNKKESDRMKKDNNALQRLKELKQNILLTLDQSSKVIETSRFNILAVSSKSLTKCMNCELESKIKKQILFKPKQPQNNSGILTNALHMKYTDDNGHKKTYNVMPSVLRYIYIDDQTTITKPNKNVSCIDYQNTFTMTDNTTNEVSIHCENINELGKQIKNDKEVNIYPEVQNNATVTVGFMNKKIEYPNLYNTTEHRKGKVLKTFKMKNRHKIHKKCRGNRISTAEKFKRMENYFSLYSKNGTRNNLSGNLLKNCHKILEQLVTYDGKRNVRFDIHVNVSPLIEATTKAVSTSVSKQSLSGFEVKRNPTLLYDIVPTVNTSTLTEKSTITEHPSSFLGNNPELISLLDGAVSQTKYIFDMSNTKDNRVIGSVNVDRSTITSELQIGQEINELKSVIKDLIKAAEKIVNENLGRDSDKTHIDTSVSRTASNNVSSSSKFQAFINLRNPSKGIQCSNDTFKNQTQSGMKLTIEPKKQDTSEFFDRLAKKSTSYRIIDSESVLKVTDMTSNNNINHEKNTNDSLPKSRSLFEINAERNKRMLLALFCDGTCNQRNYKEEPIDHRECMRNWEMRHNNGRGQCDEDEPLYTCSLSCIPPPSPRDIEDCEFCSDFNSHIELPCKEPEEQHRKGMGFGEGCVYCLMIWIPIFIIIILFYVYVIRDLIDNSKLVLRKNNLTLYNLTLADFGF